MSWFSNWLSRPPRFKAAADEYLSVSLAECCTEMQKYTRYRMERYVYPFIGQQRIHRITPTARCTSSRRPVGVVG